MTVMLYKHPGDTHLPQHGGDFALAVVNEGDVSDFLARGWHRRPQEALEAVKPESEPPKRRGRPRKSAD